MKQADAGPGDPMTSGAADEVRDAGPVRVSTIELFFDLVFVFTITQLTRMLEHDPTATGLLRVVLALGVIWWMYGGYAWLTNAVALDRTARRLHLLTGMAGYLVMALALPGAFAGDGVAFGLGYLVVTVTHTVLFTRATSRGSVHGILRIAPTNVGAALLVLGAGFLDGPAALALWSGAFLLAFAGPFLGGGLSRFVVRPGHFVERHGLVMLIVLGESIVAIGIGAAGHRVDAPLVGAAVLGLALTACLWWFYFSGDDARAEHALSAAPGPRRSLLALLAYGYAHIPLILGVVALAAGVTETLAHPFAHAHLEWAVALGGGGALYLAGDVVFRRILGIHGGGWRIAAGVVALATIPLGVFTTAIGQLAALVAVLVAALVAEHRVGGR
ncbi:low temperature requirement protein A [Plantactinospora solaniradicis]|uniref:Low temperature requirement protein A n=1 Tax=Plantactinospora solaniradicis TaxID=1723736 RepID=A0ABW1K7B1_9ACTN